MWRGGWGGDHRCGGVTGVGTTGVEGWLGWGLLVLRGGWGDDVINVVRFRMRRACAEATDAI